MIMRARVYAKLIALGVLTLSAGCAFQQKKVEQQLANPVQISCATAHGDIRMLQQEKANVVQRMAEGATAIYPGSLVVGVLTGVEDTKIQVATGDYNNKIDERIAQIKQTCGIQ
jgi:hypothetical protein